MNKLIVNIPCPKCGNPTSRVNTVNGTKFCSCTKCNTSTLITKSNQAIKAAEKPVVECPYCHSTNTKKISTTSKVAGVATFGVFALGKATKEWHCNNCKSNF